MPDRIFLEGILLGQFCEQDLEGVGGKLRAVEGGLRQAAESIGDLRGSDVVSVGEGFPCHEPGKHGGACERGDATLRFEAYSGDFAIIDAGREAKNVAADGILDIDHGCCAGQIAGVARIFEMVEDSGRIHEKEVYR